jgi:hypothetical protein
MASQWKADPKGLHVAAQRSIGENHAGCNFEPTRESDTVPSGMPKMLIATLRTAAACAILGVAPFSFLVFIGISQPRVWIAYAALGAGTTVMFLVEWRAGAMIAFKRTLGYLLLAAGVTAFAVSVAWAQVLHSWVLFSAGVLGLFLWSWVLTRWVDLRIDHWDAEQLQPDK